MQPEVRLVNCSELEILVSAEDKPSVLTHLMVVCQGSSQTFQDIEIQSPSLEQLYRHFIHADRKTSFGEASMNPIWVVAGKGIEGWYAKPLDTGNYAYFRNAVGGHHLVWLGGYRYGRLFPHCSPPSPVWRVWWFLIPLIALLLFTTPSLVRMKQVRCCCCSLSSDQTAHTVRQVPWAWSDIVHSDSVWVWRSSPRWPGLQALVSHGRVLGLWFVYFSSVLLGLVLLPWPMRYRRWSLRNPVPQDWRSYSGLCLC